MGKQFNDDIERAERFVLIVAWLGIASSVAVIAYSILGI